MAVWRCVGCDYDVGGLDEVAGYADLASALEESDSLDEVPDEWVCPQCGAGKEKLKKVEEEEEEE